MDARRPKDQKISNRSGFGVDAEITYIMDTSKILFCNFSTFLPFVTLFGKVIQKKYGSNYLNEKDTAV